MSALKNISRSIRKLSIFFLFFGLLAIIATVYFLIIIPKNEAELNERRQRILNRLSCSFIKKNREVKSLFKLPPDFDGVDIWNQNVVAHKENFGHLEDLAYSASILSIKGLKNKRDYQDSSIIELQ